MYVHRPAQRLRVLSPALLSQNNRQLNSPQSLSLTDFEGSRFDRWLRQGSGQHPLTGSPQHQWGFSFTQEPGDRLTACCSGVLAVLSERSERFPFAGHHYHQGRYSCRPFPPSLCLASSENVYSCKPFPLDRYFQNIHQGGGCSADADADAAAGASAVCISSVCRRSICWSFMASWAVSVSIRLLVPCASPGASARASASPISTLHRPSCLCAPSASALIRLRTVSAEIPRCVAASLIDKSMGSTVGGALGDVAYSAYADYGQFGGAE